MPNDYLQFEERLAWEGVVGIETALIIGAVLVSLAAWALWRERDAVGRGWAIAFFGLRLAVFGCVLWMLTGPTLLHIDRSSTKQAVAIFADNSESMEVVDPVEPAESIRWALAISGDTDDSPVARCDRMAVTLGTAGSACQQLSRYVAEHRSTEQLQGALSAVMAALTRATRHAEALLASLDGRENALANRATRITELLDGPIADSIAAIRSALDQPTRSQNEELKVRIESLSENVAGARRRAVVLATELAEKTDVTRFAGSEEIDRLTRREKESRALEAFEKEIDGALSETVRIERFQFAGAPLPVAAKTEWRNALSRSLETANFARPLEGGGDADSTDEEAAGSEVATNLSSVLEQLARARTSQSTRMAFVLTDGRHNDRNAPAPQELAASLSGMPIYIVPIGNSSPLRDVVLHRVEAPTAVATKDTAVVDVIVTAFECDGDVADVILRREGTEVDRKQVEFEGDRSDARVRFSVATDEPGRLEYVVEVTPLDDEANAANNYSPVAFDVVRDQVRVLLADSVARWEFRYLSQLFRRDTHVMCDELLFFPRVVGTGRLEQRPELPRDAAGWAGYDVVILGDLDATQLNEASQRGLDEYVRTRGGNVIIIAGRDAMPGKFESQTLMGLLPVEYSGQSAPLQGFGLRLTDEGRFHSALMIDDSEVESRKVWLEKFTDQPVLWVSEFSKPKQTARTLIRVSELLPGGAPGPDQDDPDLPSFLCWHRVGAGRVVYLSAPDTHHLRYLEGDRLHHRFWGQMLRWVTAAGAGAGTDLVRLQTDRMQYSAGDPVEVTVWLKDKAGEPLAGQSISVEARTFNDLAVTAEMTPDADVAGRYFASLPDLQAGAYNITVQGPVVETLLPPDADTELVKATVTVRATDSIEMQNTQCNRALLEQIAEMTGGQVVPPTAMGEILQLASFDPEVVEQSQETPLWNRWSIFTIVVGCLFTEWMVRKAKGLV
jgi:hypothetical protein